MTVEEIRQTGQKLFGEWGGLKRINAVTNSPKVTPEVQQLTSPASAQNKTSVSPSVSPNTKNANVSGDIESRVRRIIVEQLGVKPEQVIPTAEIVKDLGADESELVELVLAFETEFHIEIPDEDAERMKTVGDVFAYLHGHVK